MLGLLPMPVNSRCLFRYSAIAAKPYIGGSYFSPKNFTALL